MSALMLQLTEHIFFMTGV